MNEVKTTEIDLAALRNIFEGPSCISLSDDDMARIERSNQTIL